MVDRYSAVAERSAPQQRAWQAVANEPVRRAARAVRAATEREPILPPGFLGWAFGRALAMALLVGAAWVVYDSASSDRFQVRSVRVQGNVLLSRAEVENVVAVTAPMSSGSTGDRSPLAYALCRWCSGQR